MADSVDAYDVDCADSVGGGEVAFYGGIVDSSASDYVAVGCG